MRLRNCRYVAVIFRIQSPYYYSQKTRINFPGNQRHHEAPAEHLEWVRNERNMSSRKLLPQLLHCVAACGESLENTGKEIPGSAHV